MSVGRRLCRLEDIPDGKARGFPVNGFEHDLFVYRQGAAVRAFINSCPHQGTPLDWVPDQFIAPDGVHFICATHGALFRTGDGLCVDGPCLGERLKTVAIDIEEGWVILR
ncbi:MAG TPA: Rieske 2Fe-2S domain-containing protein [Alphaproteobacteria bacterium]|nr:Rieske 2Fe-2S domain-containing protein [Alphaproteobacteria bacterium]